MEQIAPLAKILAEANGIEWQQLRGSGSGGTVIEQDILNYLSRIMSGEEEPPSTPVDEMPEGWTGDEQLPAGMFSADMLSQAGIDSDIAEFVTQSRAPEAPAVNTAASAAHDSMEFELDDDMADLDAPLAAEPQPIAADWSFAPAQTPAQQPPYIHEAPQPIAAAPEPAFPSLSAPEPIAPEVQMPEPRLPAVSHTDVAAAGGGLSGLLSRLYRKDKGAEAAPAASVPAPTPMPEVQPAFVSGPASGYAAELNAPEFDLHVPVVQMPVAEVTAAEPQVEEVYAAEVAASGVQAPEMEAPELEDPEFENYVAPEYDAAPEVMAEQETAPQPAAEPEVQPPAAQPEAQPVAASASTDMPASAVWFGTYLRRDASVAAADDLCAQLSEALGKDVSLAFLVARAAQRHADVLGLDLGHVALQGADGQDRPITGSALRDAMTALHGGQASAPDLLVTDAGTLGVDDLHFPHTLTLSLGRVQDGRAALSLNGDVNPRQAAQFLTRVAESLEKPIALVL
ncbi:E3 binding domain-containing protein [Deinococcus saxicola]|uniref:E3 binding domain-containing protein n=2 Tax=Deinococcus saxicola TaxID=249406 RepID=UPI003D104BB6